MKLSVREAALLLAVTEQDLYRWVDAGEIPFYRAKHQPRFSRAELLEWATARRMPVTFALDDEASAERRAWRLGDALARGGVHHGVPGGERATALRAVVQRLPLADDDERALVSDVMIGRATLGATGVGDGVAIPHVRSPILCAGHEPAVALCYLTSVVGLTADGDPPVHTLFALVSPTIGAHLELVSRLSCALLDEGFRGAVLRRADAIEIVAEARRVDAVTAHPTSGADASALV
jgi:PTS system nitrogen regulatory IIA component